MSQKKPALRFAVCISNEDYEAALELHKIYRVLPDEDAATDGDIRVIDESGEDYLYPADWLYSLNYLAPLKDLYCGPRKINRAIC
jgi:hypothetical protein